MFQIPMLEWEFLLRMVLASVCGILIGFERSKRLKEAGVRTHCMVACGAALMMIVSKYGFTDLMGEAGTYLMGSRGADPARIAAGVVSGVSFLGAGVIVRTGISIKGLTTAAGIWATSAVGLALGAGMYFVGIAGTVLIIAEQFLMHWLNIGNDAYSIQEIKLCFQDCPEVHEELHALVEIHGGSISKSAFGKSGDGCVSYTLMVRVRRPIEAEELQRILSAHEGSYSFSL